MKLPLIVASALTVIPALTPPIDVTSEVPTATAPAAENDIGGVYECDGTRPDGAAYRGVVEIVRHNGTYELLWTFGSSEQHVGFGIVTGDVLSVSYFGGELGVVAYKIEKGEKGPRLVGQWTVPEADGQVFSETLTRLARSVDELPQSDRRPHGAEPQSAPAPAPPAPPAGHLIRSRSARAA